MKQLKLSPESLAVVGVALRMVAESDERMNTYSDETRESLEQEARLIVAGGCNSSQPVKRD
ncbi:MAG TPA: hypothetical protein VHE13_05855 [Opitutus sp.]|nr:hypothetical protein [Opitutus sp.]